MMFATVLPLPRTSISFATGPVCFLAQMGSASMAIGLSTGAFPSNVTVPLMVEAATATPGKTNTAASPAASHNLFPVLRMLGSLVIANLSSASPLTLTSARHQRGQSAQEFGLAKTLHETRHAGQPSRGVL